MNHRSRATEARILRWGVVSLCLGLAAWACGDGPTAPSRSPLLGTWAETATTFPELRGGRQRCFVFREDNTYLLEDILPSGSPVPLVLERWVGRYQVRNDTLTRTLDRDQLFSGYSGSLVPYWDYTDQGSYIQAIRVGRGTLDIRSILWVQDSGAVAVTDTYRPAVAGSCGALPL